MITDGVRLQTLLDSLIRVRSEIAEYSVFGDNNWVSMDEEIRVLQYYIETGTIPVEYYPHEFVEDLITFLWGGDEDYDGWIYEDEV